MDRAICWPDDGAWIGYLEEYPEYWTQGDTLDDLETRLADLQRDIESGEIPGVP